MRLRHVGTILGVWGIALALAVEAADWYVDNQAGGSQDGTCWTNAFTTVGHAVTNVWGLGGNGGDTIYVRQTNAAADYLERIVIGAGFADGTASAYNRIVGWSGEGYKAQPKLKLSGATVGSIIELGVTGSVARNFYELRNLSFQAANAWSDNAVRLNNQSSNIRFVSNTCYLADFLANDGTTTANTNLLIQGNRMGAASSISFRGDSDIAILDNILTNGSASAAISMAYSGGRITILGNIIATSQDGISSQTYTDITVARNRIKVGYRAGIFIDTYANNWKIYNNVFHDITGSYASLPDGVGVCFLPSGARGISVYNNTFHNFPEAGARAVRLGANANGCAIFNNIISGVATGLDYVAGAVVSNDHNDFWNVTTPHAGVAVAGANDKALDPQFVHTSVRSFALANKDLQFSAANAFAGVSAPTDDYYGSVRELGFIGFGAVQSPIPAGTVVTIR